MGAWGIKNFENDTASDWLASLSSFITDDDIYSHLNKILEEKEFIDDEESFICLALLEGLVVQLNLLEKKHNLPSLGNIDQNVLIESVIKASKKILFFQEHSELRELWLESEEYDVWFNYQIFLIKTLDEYFIKVFKISQLSDDAEIDNKWRNYIRINFS